MLRRPPGSTRTDTLFPYTTLFRSRLDAARIEVAKVLEGEHQRLDALCGIAVTLFESAEEAGLQRAVEVVEDVGHELVRVAAVGLRQVRHERVAQGAQIGRATGRERGWKYG